jgi:hypothetical protein
LADSKLLEFDFYWLGEYLLACLDHGMFCRCVQVTPANLWRVRMGHVQQVGEKVVDLLNL